MTDDTLPPRELRLLGELDRRREDERDEREERRGLENRASALLAAGAAVIGLVATAVLDLNVRAPDRVLLLVGVALASAIMVLSFAFIVVALSGRAIPAATIVHDPETELKEASQRVQVIRNKNLDMLHRLRQATVIFAVAVAAFTGVVFWAAVAAHPPAIVTPKVVVRPRIVVHGVVGPRGPRGHRGPRGRRGPADSTVGFG